MHGQTHAVNLAPAVHYVCTLLCYVLILCLLVVLARCRRTSSCLTTTPSTSSSSTRRVARADRSLTLACMRTSASPTTPQVCEHAQILKRKQLVFAQELAWRCMWLRCFCHQLVGFRHGYRHCAVTGGCCVALLDADTTFVAVSQLRSQTRMLAKWWSGIGMIGTSIYSQQTGECCSPRNTWQLNCCYVSDRGRCTCCSDAELWRSLNGWGLEPMLAFSFPLLLPSLSVAQQL